MKIKKSQAFIAAYAVLLVVTLSLVLKFGAKPEKSKPKVGFITNGDISASGWSATNYQGIKEACDSLGTELLIRSQIPESDGSCPQAVKELVKEGAEMIILNSYGYSQEIKEMLDDYPDVSFYGASANYSAPNLISYSTRLYQARYLSGIVAGMHTKTGKIGFVAAARKVEVYRGINAFALGIQRVNPDAEVVVAFTNTWDDKEKEIKAAEALMQKEGVDVITYHQDYPYVIEAAEKAGIASIGYYEVVEGVSDNYLTCVACDWVPLYKTLIREYLRGQSNDVSIDWLGLESGVVHITDYSPLVSQEARDEVEQATKEILSGQDVFSGIIYDNQGNQRCDVGEAMSDATLTNGIDWLAKGVRIYEE